jgi:diaminopimelate decarboxylase
MTIEALKTEIARQFGTPAVVVDLDVVERNIARAGDVRCGSRRAAAAY